MRKSPELLVMDTVNYKWNLSNVRDVGKIPRSRAIIRIRPGNVVKALLKS